ncbi:MAG: hypothetical protein JOS17DRAFT_150874 [Linnemannia elongata]|nr:MAG: hypothetical protein JOS17DRAFT_150874 [Linnemannia elongata]
MCKSERRWKCGAWTIFFSLTQLASCQCPQCPQCQCPIRSARYDLHASPLFSFTTHASVSFLFSLFLFHISLFFFVTSYLLTITSFVAFLSKCPIDILSFFSRKSQSHLPSAFVNSSPVRANHCDPPSIPDHSHSHKSRLLASLYPQVPIISHQRQSYCPAFYSHTLRQLHSHTRKREREKHSLVSECFLYGLVEISPPRIA